MKHRLHQLIPRDGIPIFGHRQKPCDAMRGRLRCGSFWIHLVSQNTMQLTNTNTPPLYGKTLRKRTSFPFVSKAKAHSRLSPSFPPSLDIFPFQSQRHQLRHRRTCHPSLLPPPSPPFETINTNHQPLNRVNEFIEFRKLFSADSFQKILMPPIIT